MNDWTKHVKGLYLKTVNGIEWELWHETDTDYIGHYTYGKWIVRRNGERMEYCCKTLKLAKEYALDCMNEIEESNKRMELMRQP